MFSPSLVSLAVVLSCLLGLAAAYEELHVMSPISLSSAYPEGLPHTPALFGVPSYGSSITGQVYYATSGVDVDGCDPLSEADYSSLPAGSIFMVDRGNCSFVEKVRHIQNAGAAVAIIANYDDYYIPYMMDDGTGIDITIPAVMLSLSVANALKESISNGIPVTLNCEWSLPAPDGRVEWELWTSSNDPGARAFKSEFSEAVEALGEAAEFTPHYLILNGIYSGCTIDWIDCGSQCTDNSLYCAVDPDHDLDTNLSGKDIVLENLRQLCMWQVLNATDSATEKLKWWTYSQEFIYECCEPEGDFIHGSCTSTDWGEACSYAVMDDVGIDSSLVDQCVLDSWNDDGTNSVLEAEMTRAYEHSVDRTGLPTMYINTAPYRGTLTCEQPLSAYTCGALEAICAGYEAGTEPDACTGDIGCGLGEHTDACGMCGGDGAYDKCGICMSQSNPDFGTYCESSFDPTAIIIVAVVLAFLIPAWIWYYRKQQEQQRRNIDDILRSYLPLEDANEIAGHDTEDASFISRNNNNIAVHSDDVELVQPSNLTIA